MITPTNNPKIFDLQKLDFDQLCSFPAGKSIQNPGTKMAKKMCEIEIFPTEDQSAFLGAAITELGKSVFGARAGTLTASDLVASTGLSQATVIRAIDRGSTDHVPTTGHFTVDGLQTSDCGLIAAAEHSFRIASVDKIRCRGGRWFVQCVRGSAPKVYRGYLCLTPAQTRSLHTVFALYTNILEAAITSEAETNTLSRAIRFASRYTDYPTMFQVRGLLQLAAGKKVKPIITLSAKCLSRSKLKVPTVNGELKVAGLPPHRCGCDLFYDWEEERFIVHWRLDDVKVHTE